jgi:hypothetical protein
MRRPPFLQSRIKFVLDVITDDINLLFIFVADDGHSIADKALDVVLVEVVVVVVVVVVVLVVVVLVAVVVKCVKVVFDKYLNFVL